MEEFSSLLPLEEDDFLFHHTVPTEYLQQQTIRQDLPIPDASLITPVLEKNDLINVNKNGKRQQKSATVQEDAVNIGSYDDNQQKRSAHRDIERQRRKEMGKLFGSLRALPPLEFIKGKRSMCDQVNEAVNYIKYQEKNIRQLQEKKEKLLRNLLVASNPDTKEGNSCPFDIRIRQCSHGGIEILISNDVGDQEKYCPISSVMKVLVETGLTVVSYFSSKVNDKFIYTIETEAIHITGHDIHILLQKLSHKTKASTNFHRKIQKQILLWYKL